MKRAMVISPAGNPEKLRFAVKFGADEVYFGGDQFNLRVQADNFSHEELAEAAVYCREHSVKTTFLMNAFLHDADVREAEKFIRSIKDYGFDAVMVSDPGMLMILKDSGITAEFHLSTQMNTLNRRAVKFWMEAGFSRIVLARETSLDEIRMIKESTGAEIEVFAHGALCVAYSGRCLLSRYLSGRDANSGDCAQPCRWRYSLIEEKRPGNYLDVIEHAKGTEILSSMDLQLIDKLEQYVEAGVDAFKIEGRMKSLYHAANTTRIYRHACGLAGTPEFEKMIPFWLAELDLVSHRPYTSDLFNEFGAMGEFSGVPYINKAVFLGYRESGSSPDAEITMKTFNPVYAWDRVEAIYPIEGDVVDDSCTVVEITDPSGRVTDMARPNTVCTVKFDKPILKDAVFRKRI